MRVHGLPRYTVLLPAIHCVHCTISQKVMYQDNTDMNMT